MKKAFSLIEILVTLIIISLLASAFVPVVTKKLKSSEITIGSFGTAVTTDECEQFSSQHHKCILCRPNSCSLCTSQLDVPDGLYVDPSISCDPKECKTKFGSACATCNKDRCTSCPNTTPSDSYAVPEENCAIVKCSDKHGANCATCKKESCTSCKTPTSSSQYADLDDGCKFKNCSEKFGSYCTSCTKDSCLAYSCPSGYGFNSTTHTCKKCDAGYYSPGGIEGCKKCETGKVSSAGAASCSECSASSHKVANATQTACEDKNCDPGYYIDGITCKPCADGMYKTGTNQNSCTPCASTCGTCGKTDGKCTSCALSGYTLSSSGTCTLGCNPQTVTLSGTNIKVSKYNMGDDPNCPREALTSLSGVTFVPGGTKCEGDLCCWYGQTAPAASCTSADGSYSSCDRTVCKWAAADKLCASIGTGWKLPTITQMTSTNAWYTTNSTATTGLMLCDGSSTSTKAYRCMYVDKCQGATHNRCYAYHVWATNGTGAKEMLLNKGTWTLSTNCGGSKLLAHSVRCIKE